MCTERWGEREEREGWMKRETEKERKRERVFKELTYTVKGGCKSEICRAALQTGDPEKS